MPLTILITGASSGIGKETAKLFAARGWQVIATMRNPQESGDLACLDNVFLTKLDVTDSESIAKAVEAGLERFGKIDALLNNAGYGAYGPLEASTMERIRRQFDTNVIGLLETTKAVLPHLRKQGSGTIINISSIGGQMAFPLGSLYHGTKFAVEGLSESLYYELEAVGIRVKLVEPGMIATDFAGRSFDMANDESLSGYQPVVKGLFGSWSKELKTSEPIVVAEVIWKAATDGASTLRYRAGADAEELLNRRKLVDDATFMADLKKQFGLI